MPLEEIATGGIVEFVPAQFRAEKGFGRLRVRNLRAFPGKRGKLALAPLGNGPSQLVVVIREKQERRARAPFLALEEHRRERPEQHERGDRLERGRIDELAQALAEGTIADLVVILRADDELVRRDIERRTAVRALAVSRVLTVEHVALLERLREVAERSEIRVITAALAGEERVDRVVKIVHPMRVESVAAARGTVDEAGIVEIALGDEDARTPVTAESSATRAASVSRKCVAFSSMIA